jgi:hypothetical protein
MWKHRPLRTVLIPPLEKKILDDGDTPGLTGNLLGSCSERVPLRREQWEELASSHAGQTESRTETSEKKEQWYTNRIFRMDSLKEEAM